MQQHAVVSFDKNRKVSTGPKQNMNWFPRYYHDNIQIENIIGLHRYELILHKELLLCAAIFDVIASV
jgi:hypothetical protein